jgi:4-diphosphocytidyl-2-C-methyl-D-erythritol kinase
VSDRATTGGTRVLAPAKINVWLDVLGRRPDGYHELDTGLLALDLCDELEARAVPGLEGVRLEVDGPQASHDIPSDRTNLACAAASAALVHAKSDRLVAGDVGIELKLTKRVPSRAGLGGGSSDAAAALLAVERACGFELEARAARGLLAALGSDCVFFRAAASTGFARCTGRGESVALLPAIDAQWSFVVVTPRATASTTDVYRAHGELLRKTPPATTVRLNVFELGEVAARTLLFNRLEDAALALLPELRDWRSVFDETDSSHFRMCGSGSSFFGLFRERASAAAALDRIAVRARARGLEIRGAWVLHPAGHGAKSLR